MLDEDVPREMPEEFKDVCLQMGYRDFPVLMRDENHIVQMYYSREEIELDLARTIRRVKELVFPYHGL
jgi:hypothetical protein